jgi:metal-responsive CopG/Arc/MetJ family transcriptional regulator
MTSKRTNNRLTVSVPAAVAEDFDRLAEQAGRSRSELFREMLVV